MICMPYEENKTRDSKCWEGMLFLVSVQGRLFEDMTFEQMDKTGKPWKYEEEMSCMRYKGLEVWKELEMLKEQQDSHWRWRSVGVGGLGGIARHGQMRSRGPWML